MTALGTLRNLLGDELVRAMTMLCSRASTCARVHATNERARARALSLSTRFRIFFFNPCKHVSALHQTHRTFDPLPSPPSFLVHMHGCAYVYAHTRTHTTHTMHTTHAYSLLPSYLPLQRLMLACSRSGCSSLAIRSSKVHEATFWYVLHPIYRWGLHGKIVRACGASKGRVLCTDWPSPFQGMLTLACLHNVCRARVCVQ